VSMSSSTLTVDDASMHHVNKVVEVEHNETSFDYRSLRYTINKCETTHDDESRRQGTNYIQKV
jgi:hypothetical protein